MPGAACLPGVQSNFFFECVCNQMWWDDFLLLINWIIIHYPSKYYTVCTTGEEEDIEHLFFKCPFAQACWQIIGYTWDNNTQGMFAIIIYARSQQNQAFFMDVTLIAAWEIYWKMRNRKIFDNEASSINDWFTNFRAQCLLQSVRFKEGARSSFCVCG